MVVFLLGFFFFDARGGREKRRMIELGAVSAWVFCVYLLEEKEGRRAIVICAGREWRSSCSDWGRELNREGFVSLFFFSPSLVFFPVAS